MVTRAVIAISTSLSDAISAVGNRLVAIVMPASWTTAGLTFQGSSDGVNFFDVYDEAGAEVSVAAAASHYIALDASALALSGVQYVKIRSGTSGSPVSQVAARAIQLIFA